MVRNDPRRPHQQMRLGVLLALPVIGLASACAMETNGDQAVSSNGRPSSQQQELRGVVGTVTSVLDGEPISGATINARSLDPAAPPIPELLVLSQSEGQYFWPLKPGTYELTVNADGYASLTKPVQVEPKNLITSNFALTKAR